MLFTSLAFLLYFFPLSIAAYYACKFSRTLQNIMLFFFSLVFYAWGEPRYVVLVLFSILLNYFLGLLLFRLKQKTFKRVTLTVGIVANLSVLFFFKYLGFVISNINPLFHTDLPVTQFVLPIGISFYTFETISYIVDVYRGTINVQNNPLFLGLYITFYPHLTAGPIIRYNTIEDQIRYRKETFQKFSYGFCRFILGLSKKLLIANNMSIVADRIYSLADTQTIPGDLAWVGSIAYTLQIFFDFSAYSDMAIGIGYMFGFTLPENFNYPYISRSITEFWRRWHISLSQWFRDYVYFPLGGSRVPNLNLLIRNLFIVWVLTGTWHGANWTFIAWGFMYFVLLAFERITGLNDRQEKSRKEVVIRWIYTMMFVNLGWVLFRSPDIASAFRFMAAMFTPTHFFSGYAWMFLKEYSVFFIAGLVFSLPVGRRFNYLLVNRQIAGVPGMLLMWCYPILLLSLFVISIIYIIKGSYNPFIYFNF